MKVLSVDNLYSIKHDLFPFTGEWADILGEQPTRGVWCVQGKEKHGKTAFVLSLVKYLASFKRVLYVSAEEGTGALFVKTTQRAGITRADKVGFLPYVPIEDLNGTLKKRYSAEVVVIDNVTIYEDEFQRGGLKAFLRENPNKLIIFINHEERKEPATSAGRMTKKLANVIVRVDGLIATVGGRCPGGRVIIHEEKAELYGITFETAA
jgi:predicted ATP-dependent serine protease